ncbi:MAG TPA: Gfo/Idh/MocA family oxidoreductase [Planctomycetota bacterium]|nr:Gfo/Idh/MocA family oxidoreductase [Planctomycetota bacterium]
MKVGVIGLGGMGLSHAREVRRIAFVREVIGCDLSSERRAGAESDGFRTVADVDTLVGEKPDAVIVATQPTTHAAVIRACLEAGVPVLTEKPLSTDVAEGRELVALAAAKCLHFQVGFELPYNGSIVGMRDIVDRGLIGKPRTMNLVQISGSRLRGITRVDNAGTFYEKLCHEIDLYRYFFGEPERVLAVSGPRVLDHYDCADNVLACLQFPGGEVGNITFITTRATHIGGGPDGAKTDHEVRGHYYEIILSGTKGSVSYDAWTGTLELVRYNHRDDHKSELVESINVLERYGKPEYNIPDQDRDFLTCVHEKKPLRFPASNAQISMEWVERAERSLALGGDWVGIDD